ncbi:MAG: hypothetical protein WA020_08170, partial [Candidatus Acidiferrales bacterium]
TSIVGAVLLFASVVVMYFGYSPYAAAFQNYLAASNPGEVHQSLLRFAVLQELPIGVVYSFQRIYFWYTVIALGGAIIVWITLRRVLRTLHPHAPIHPTA